MLAVESAAEDGTMVLFESKTEPSPVKEHSTAPENPTLAKPKEIHVTGNETSPALAKSKPKTIDIFKKLDESREKAAKLREEAKELPPVIRQSHAAQGSDMGKAAGRKPRPVTVSKKERYRGEDV